LGQIHGSGAGNWSNTAQVTNNQELLVTGSFSAGNTIPISGMVRTWFGNNSLDTFFRLKVAEPFSLSDNIFKYDVDPLRWDQISTGSSWINHNNFESSVDLFCGSGSGDRIIFQQREYNRYQAGRGFGFLMTGAVGDTGKANVIRRWGLFDDQNGIFLELSGTALGVVVRSNVTGTPANTRIEQSAWNGDKLDGTGSSGFNIDVAKQNIYLIQFQWLGAGRIEFGVLTSDKLEGDLIFHTVENVNVRDVPFMSTAVLPVRYEQVNVDNTGSQSKYKAVCSSVYSDGGATPPEYIFGANSSAETSVGTTQQHLISLRLGSMFGSITNRTIVVPNIISVATETKSAAFSLLLNSSVTNIIYSGVDVNSCVEVAVGSTTFSGGTPLSTFSIAKDSSSIFNLDPVAGTHKLHLTTNASGNSSDVLTLVARSSAATAAVIASITWGEIR